MVSTRIPTNYHACDEADLAGGLVFRFLHVLRPPFLGKIWEEEHDRDQDEVEHERNRSALYHNLRKEP